MQLTRLDRWLRETFVLQTQIYTMRAVEPVPSGIRHEELPEQPGRRFKHRYTTAQSKIADKFIALLKHNGQMFTTRIVERQAWYVPYLAPKNNGSVTWFVVTSTCIVLGAIGLLGVAVRLWQDPTIQMHLRESLQILKG
ncbi:hypothetical protein KBB96_02820 [Luteolibacter ambystomatis]|uniref:Uncharacterized protein n=1 Tax=Luteolibacter ambystomatis TaxID=2824561 RepID=A0A975J0M0_9BACT|nr:hypothetical protein [Luteolibacter ambystomatis]QUE51830.1 hypothetical protein KBB96_02820 [Luteolibacter ambystomatis]